MMQGDPFDDLDAFVDADGDNGLSQRRRESVATRLVRLTDDYPLFVSDDITPDAFADVTEDGVRRTLRVQGDGFRRWLSNRYFEAAGGVANEASLRDAARVIAARAQQTGVRLPVSTRVGHLNGGVYIDLGDETGRAIAITANGWALNAKPPVRFLRPAGARALPVPESGGDLQELRRHIRFEDDAAFAVVCAWLIYALAGQHAFPLALITGDHGAAKTTTARMLKRLIDPHHAEDGSAPRREDDVWTRARGHRALVYDNVSSLTAEQSDLLCKIATGFTVEKRRLYTDAEVVGAVICRPQIANGIVDFANRPDLLDRAIMIRLSRIPDEERQPENAIWVAFDAARPRLLGALCDAIALAMLRKDEVKQNATARLADFHRFSLAAEPAFGAPGAFEDGLRRAELEAAEIAIAASLVGEAVVSFMANRRAWSSAPTDLLEALRREASLETTSARGFPKTAAHLSADLKRIAHALRRVGVHVVFSRSGQRGRWIELHK